MKLKSSNKCSKLFPNLKIGGTPESLNMTEKLDHNNGKKEKRIIKNCYNCEKIHTNKVKIKSYSIV